MRPVSERYTRDVREFEERQLAYRRRRARERRPTGAWSPLAAAALAGGALALSALVGRRYSPGPNHPATRRWYRDLEKPAFTPPDAVFGGVWPVLEIMLAVGAYRLLRQPSSADRDTALALWGLNVALIGGWTKLFFGERSLRGGAAAAAFQFGAGAGYVAYAVKVDGAAGALGVPYVAWVGFANVLAEEIWRKNA